jgi:uncharacterized protein
MLDLFPLTFSRDVILDIEVLTACGASFRVADMSRHMPLLSGPSSSPEWKIKARGMPCMELSILKNEKIGLSNV